eukprot:2010700-Pleurochrysis_carterae.AAC.3
MAQSQTAAERECETQNNHARGREAQQCQGVNTSIRDGAKLWLQRGAKGKSVNAEGPLSSVDARIMDEAI